MATDVLTLPKGRKWPLWGAGLGLIVVLFATAVSNPFSVTVETTISDWEAQGASNCSDAYGAFDAFIPGMRGHGSCTRGGFKPGASVYVVTNTNNSGSGSLRTGVGQCGPNGLVILFNVSGLIDGSSSNALPLPNNCNGLTIAGASSPNGITIFGGSATAIRTNYASNVTIDHVTIANGGSPALRRSIVIGTGGSTSENLILANTNVVWGPDESITCYPPRGSEHTGFLLWQSIVSRPIPNSAGSDIRQNTCVNTGSIRNLYIHSAGRNPLIRGDGYFQANVLNINYGYESSTVQACDGISTPADANVRMHFINNVGVQGQNSSSSMETIRINGAPTCTNLSIYESGTGLMNDNQVVQNCNNHACVSGDSPDSWASSTITAVYPDGYVPESVTHTQSGYLAFANKIIANVGPHPNNRIPFISTAVAQAINNIDGTGDRGGWNAGGGYGGSGGANNDTVAEQGGVSVITPSAGSWDATAQCGGMPTGAAADVIDPVSNGGSGLTALHEWYITCHYDRVMPTGYRESL